MWTSRWRIVLVVLVAVVLLALAGSWTRRGARGRCELDGGVIDSAYRVRIEDEGGASHSFCCIRCAQLWLAASPEGHGTVYVTVEASGQEIEATHAWFVRSPVITKASTGNRIHAFRDRVDAERHAHNARGRMLIGSDRPFAQE